MHWHIKKAYTSKLLKCNFLEAGPQSDLNAVPTEYNLGLQSNLERSFRIIKFYPRFAQIIAVTSIKLNNKLSVLKRFIQ